MGIPGGEVTKPVADLIRKIQPGAFILFNRNLETAEQVFRLIQDLNSLSEIQPIICLDQEGGRVARLKVLSEAPVGAYDLCLKEDRELFYEHGKHTGELMSLFGFNLNLAPVVDYSIDETRDNSLRGRCLGRSPEEVISNAEAFLSGMKEYGVLGTAKHFPGYSFCGLDPHGDLPVISRSLTEMEEGELKVFRHFAAQAPAFMIGHGHFKQWHDEPFPASLSREIISELLVKGMGYEGLVMTDDLEMGAISNRYNAEACTKLAMKAGVDQVMFCHNPACAQIAFETLQKLPEAQVEKALEAVRGFKEKLPSSPERFQHERLEEVNTKIRALRERVQE